MKIALVRLADQFGVPSLKTRPCIVLSQTKKHMRVCLYTHHPRFRDYQHGIIFSGNRRAKNWLDLTQVFIVRKEYVKMSNYHVNPRFQEEINKTLKKIKGQQIVHCVTYNKESDIF